MDTNKMRQIHKDKYGTEYCLSGFENGRPDDSCSAGPLEIPIWFKRAWYTEKSDGIMHTAAGKYPNCWMRIVDTCDSDYGLDSLKIMLTLSDKVKR